MLFGVSERPKSQVPSAFPGVSEGRDAHKEGGRRGHEESRRRAPIQYRIPYIGEYKHVMALFTRKKKKSIKLFNEKCCLNTIKSKVRNVS